MKTNQKKSIALIIFLFLAATQLVCMQKKSTISIKKQTVIKALSNQDEFKKFIQKLKNSICRIKLDLSNTKISDKQFSKIIHGCSSRITELNLTNCINLTPEGLHEIENLANLEALSLRKTKVTSYTINSIPVSVKKLFLQNYRIPNWLSENYTKQEIRSLLLQGPGRPVYRHISKKGFLSLSRLKNLTTLYVIDTKIGLKTITNLPTAIQYLHISTCKNLLNMRLNHLTNLKELKIENHYLTDNVVKNLPESLKTIVILCIPLPKKDIPIVLAAYKNIFKNYGLGHVTITLKFQDNFW